MEHITYEIKEAFSRNKRNANITHVVDTVLAAAAEARIDENWWLLDNKSTCNAFINEKYL